MARMWRSCLPFYSRLTLTSRLKAMITRKAHPKSPDEREYALLSDPESDLDSDSDHAVTCAHIEDLDNQYNIQDTSVQGNPTVRLAGEYPRPRTPPKAKTKTTTKAEVEVKERYVRFGIGGAGNMRRSVLIWIITRALICICICMWCR